MVVNPFKHAELFLGLSKKTTGVTGKQSVLELLQDSICKNKILS